MKDNSYIAEFMIASEGVYTWSPGSLVDTEKSSVREYPYFYERASKICIYRIDQGSELLEQNVAWILQTFTVDGGMLAANIITEDSINPKNSNLN